MSLSTYIRNVSEEYPLIPQTRRELLLRLADYISRKLQTNEPVNLVFICTHNSRRSQFGQIWAAIAADHFGLPQVHTFSGGTEVTRFHPNAVAALQRAGVSISTAGGDDNPIYEVSVSSNTEPLRCFSKLYSHSSNPDRDFAAVMTCSEADTNCPFIPGASIRIPASYEDPGKDDLSADRESTYDSCCRQIAREMLYTFSHCRRH